MRLTLHIKLFLTLLCIFLSACGGGSSSSDGAAQEEQENLILVLGDSIGAGTHTSITFPDVIASLTGIPLVNESTPSISAEQGVSRASSLIEQYNPRYIVSLLGTNNALGAGGQADGAIRSRQTLAEICVENGIVCIIGTIPPITLDSSLNGNVKKINIGYRGISDARIAFVYSAMDASHIGADGIHPNDQGQRVIGEVFSAQLP